MIKINSCAPPWGGNSNGDSGDFKKALFCDFLLSQNFVRGFVFCKAFSKLWGKNKEKKTRSQEKFF